MKLMEWIIQHKGSLRGAALILLLVAMVGPWFFSSDGKPPAEWCHKPNILLGNGSCVSLVSGVEIYSFTISGSLSLIKQLVTVAITGRIREYIIMFLLDGLLLLLVQPIFSTLLLRYGEDRPRRRIYNRIAWVLAVVVAGILIGVSYRFSGLGVELWGVWLYFGVGAGMLVVEFLLLVSMRRSSQV
jgi:hypothetical protein